MTKSELRKLISESESKEWFQSLSISINYSHLNTVKEFTGFSNYYNYINAQLKNWESIEETLPNELNNSKQYYKSVLGHLDGIIANYLQREGYPISQNQSGWNNIQRHLNNVNLKPLIFEDSMSKFLIELHRERPNLFKGAFSYITNQPPSNISNKDIFTGYLLAYEFENAGKSTISKRSKQEKKSLSELKQNFEVQLQDSENQMIRHLSSYNDEYKIKSKEIQEFKAEKELIFNAWYGPTVSTFKEFDKTSRLSIKDLENTYEEKLRLKKPAQYWKIRAEKLKADGKYYFNIMICLLIIVCLSLYVLLVITPDGMLTSFENTESAIKWSIVYIMFISLMVYGVRVAHKIAFSSFHLARDAEEREQLTHVYLALVNDTEMDIEEKKLIIQSLFSRADTGLLREDSSPTMPNDFLGKLMK